MSQKTDLSNELLVALGNLLVAFNDVDMLLKGFIGFLLRIGGIQSTIVTYRLHWPALLDRIYALYSAEVTRPDMQKQLSDILSEISKCNTRRNEFIHSEWTLGCGDDVPILFKPVLDLRFKQDPLPVDSERVPLGEVHPSKANELTNPQKVSVREVRPDEVNALINDLRKREFQLRDVQSKLLLFRHMNPRPDFLIDWRTPDELQ